MSEIGFTSGLEPEGVLVQVVPIDSGRAIAWGSSRVEQLSDRLGDINEAIAAGARSVADGLANLPSPTDWEITEVSGTFGISLSAEAGVIITKASAETTFEVNVKFERKSPTDGSR